jgi:hypothetical protein
MNAGTCLFALVVALVVAALLPPLFKDDQGGDQ